MAIESEPSHNLDESSQNEAWVEKNARLLLTASPDELVTYSQQHFGYSQRLIAIKACEKQLDLYYTIDKPEKVNSYLAVLPTLWGLYDESKSV